MNELAPAGTNARMTKAQVKKYIQDMKKAQAIAQEKLKKAEKNGEFKNEKKELEEIEKKLNEL